MLRRDFLRLSVLAPLASFSWRADAGPYPAGGFVERAPDGQPHHFELKARDFMLDGKPFQIRSGEMHPIRIPVEYWRHRIRMAKAMGLNTVSLYLMWNALESAPGVFDLTGGRHDFVRFIRLCQEEGMWVYLRPGPFIAGEWDFGGLPPYLLRYPHIRVRDKNDPDYMAAVRRYFDAIAPHIAPLMVGRGGPILMLQIENEYASYGSDLSYMQMLRAMWRERGVDGPFSISDGLEQIQKEKTYLSGAALGLDGDTGFANAQAIAGEMPVWQGEGYPGWITFWGDKDFARGDFVGTLRLLLQQNRSFNLYVVHGGTNFGFGAGAGLFKDAQGVYSKLEPVITSYDYGAPIDERGAPTADYFRFRALIAERLRQTPRPVPSPVPVAGFPAVMAQPYASLWDNLPSPVHVLKPQPNELLFAQDQGMVLYRKSTSGGDALTIDGVCDYATVFHDGRYLDHLSRVQKSGLRSSGPIQLARTEHEAPLDILVDSFGHAGPRPGIVDRKGIVGSIRLGQHELQDWEVYSLPLDNAYLAELKPLRNGAIARSGMFFKATLSLDPHGDTYIDMSAWEKGYLWINRQLLGRYWKIGPQQRLYCPASWLRRGDNEWLVFDLHRTVATPIRGVESLHG
ncbi:MAG TPA: beta-galactosidase [Dyella sp.]|nr:beta-galactosidase [Dyella sp.]